MIIFSNSSILASPDKYDLKKIHIIFNKIGDDYDQINILFKKFSLIQVNLVRCIFVTLFISVYFIVYLIPN